MNTENVKIPIRPEPPKEQVKLIRRIVPVVAAVLIIVVLFAFIERQRTVVETTAENALYQMAEHLSAELSDEIAYATNSINLIAVNISQSMTSNTLENPAEKIEPMVENTPFGAIEYIRADGMNVMNIGEPFDASDREYYIEGMKGNTGIWNNYHPKTSQETLMNFYAPLIHDGKPCGVITGYIMAKSQIASVLESSIYGEDIYGLLLDENNMVICSTFDGEYIKDLSLDMFLDQYGLSEEQKQNSMRVLGSETDGTIRFKDRDGEGRVCIKTIPDTNWRVVFVVPGSSFDAIIGNNAKNSTAAVVIVSLIIILYAAYVLLHNIKMRREVAVENARLEQENRLFNEENKRAFEQISEIRDIIASANMGTWKIELVEKEEPRMYVDETMKRLLGTEGQDRTPEETYTDWFANITPEAVESVLHSVSLMQKGYFDENTYKWIHPTKGVRYVRCGGTAQLIPGGFLLRGYHYDVDEVVRKEQAQMLKLQEALDEKREYYATLGSLGGIFYSLHVLDLKADTAVEFNAKNEVKDIVNHKQGATFMMKQVMNTVTDSAYLEDALEFTNLISVPGRMKNRQIISREFLGKNVGWFLASFITMEKDDEGKPTKVLFASRIIDEEKREQERLIKKTQTDEMTGLLNRRAYEESIYQHNDKPEEDNFIYVSIDVNGLKVVNDTKGHMAGDELIIGACQCMKDALGSYGNLYRIGGDEFVAILFCNESEIESVLENFDATVSGWSGKLIDSLTVSYGWVSKHELPDASTRQLGAVAEERMYAAKAAHYRRQGVDRRGQQDAHKALCNLYTKILGINLTEDSYKIINMNESEQTTEKGFAEKISEWLASFGKSGQVHPDDLDEYLRLTDIEYMKEYFKSRKSSLSISYRRKYDDGFKKVMMEIIPANDYSDDYQSLFLYVKDIDI